MGYPEAHSPAAPSAAARQQALHALRARERAPSGGPPPRSDSPVLQWVGDKAGDAESAEFSRLQQLISRGIACAEAGEEPDEDIDMAASFGKGGERFITAEVPANVGPMPPPQGACRARGESPRAQLRSMRPAASQPAALPAPTQHAGAVAAGSSTTPPLHSEQPPAARSRMAEIRAAAERRAYRTDHDVSVALDEEPVLTAAGEAQRSSMSAIRAIAERRAAQARAGGCSSGVGAAAAVAAARSASARRSGSTTPRGHGRGVSPVPLEQSAVQGEPPRTTTPRSSGIAAGGAYRPAHVYSGRNGPGGAGVSGGGLSEALGLRFGQPPPGRKAAVAPSAPATQAQW